MRGNDVFEAPGCVLCTWCLVPGAAVFLGCLVLLSCCFAPTGTYLELFDSLKLMPERFRLLRLGFLRVAGKTVAARRHPLKSHVCGQIEFWGRYNRKQDWRRMLEERYRFK